MRRHTLSWFIAQSSEKKERARTILAHEKKSDTRRMLKKNLPPFNAVNRAAVICGCGWIERLLKVWPVFIHYFITLGRFFRSIWDKLGNTDFAVFPS